MAEEDESALTLTLGSMTPSALPSSRRIRLRGSVTNTTDETWTTIRVYPFASWNRTFPIAITDSDQLAAEVAKAPEEAVGERFTDPDNYRTIKELGPGETARYTATITAEQVERVTGSGVYWIGVHALGQSESVPRDGFADGRARTFIPLVPEGGDSVPTAIVASLRGGVKYAPDGSLANADRMSTRLAATGRLDRLLNLGDQSSVPITWLVDPAVPDAVQRLSVGNPPRSSEPAEPLEEGAEPAAPASPEASGADPSATPSGPPVEELSPDEAQAATDARAWLKRAGEVLEGSELLLLPFGDIDVEATMLHDPDWYLEARERGGDTLAPWRLEGSPTVAPPRGLLSAEAITALPEDTQVLVSDAAFTSPTATKLLLEGHPVTVTDGTATTGGPGPDDRFGRVSVRQQLLAEVALRALGDAQPMVAVLPATWMGPRNADAADRFVGGLDVPWLSGRSLANLDTQQPTTLTGEEPAIEESELETSLPAANIEAAREFDQTGTRLGRVLFRNETLADEVTDEAMVATSYGAARTPKISLATTMQAERNLRQRLASISVEEPLPVTLSSETGKFGVTLANGLDQPVEIRLTADGDGGVEVDVPDLIRLQAGARTTVYPEASSDALGLHKVVLRITDVDGNPIGSSVPVEVRATRVSRVIWVLIGVGLVLLFSAILLRLFRRTREALR